MSSQITVRIPDDIAEWLDRSASKTETVIGALRAARRAETHQRIRDEYARIPAGTPDDWGDPTEFSDANRSIIWSDDEG